MVNPSTTVTVLEHGISCDVVKFKGTKCDVLAEQILAPFSGNTLVTG